MVEVHYLVVKAIFQPVDVLSNHFLVVEVWCCLVVEVIFQSVTVFSNHFLVAEAMLPSVTVFSNHYLVVKLWYVVVEIIAQTGYYFLQPLFDGQSNVLNCYCFPNYFLVVETMLQMVIVLSKLFSDGRNVVSSGRSSIPNRLLLFCLVFGGRRVLSGGWSHAPIGYYSLVNLKNMIFICFHQ